MVATRPPGLLATAPMRALGALSYGVYLWHLPVLHVFRLHGLFPDRALVALPVVLGPTLAVAAASFVLVERPVLRVVDRALRDGRRRRAAASVTRRPAPGPGVGGRAPPGVPLG